MKKRKVTFEVSVPIWLDDEHLEDYFRSLFGEHLVIDEKENPLIGHELQDLFPKNIKIEES